MTTIVNRGEWVRGTTVSTSADRLSAYHVRQFVRSMDEAGVPDSALVTDRHANDTRALIGLFVRIEEEHLHNLDDNGTCRGCGEVIECGCPFRGHGFRHVVFAP